MANKLELFSTVKSGKLQANTTRSILKALEALEGKRIVITIEKLSSKRSHQQNKYIHVLFTAFKDGLNELGNDFTMQQVKDLCKAKFALIDMVNEGTGEIVGQRIKGTSEMGKLELNDFFEKVIRWAAETFNIQLFYPNEELTIYFEDED